MKKMLFKIFLVTIVIGWLTACETTPEPEITMEEDYGTTTTITTEPIIDEALLTTETIEEISPTIEGFERQPVIDEQAILEERLRETQVFYFEFDKSDIKDKYHDTMIAHSRFLIENPDLRIILHGHADERGTREYNMALGERRGLNIEEVLLRYGVPRSQLETISHGEEKPAIASHNEKAWSLNRRVEMEYRR